MLKCKVCGKEFESIIEKHYVARNESISGAVTAISKSEEKLFDAFDCPYCGCQIIIQERKREFIIPNVVKPADDDDENDKSNYFGDYVENFTSCNKTCKVKDKCMEKS